jgi:hypothetical protein
VDAGKLGKRGLAISLAFSALTIRIIPEADARVLVRNVSDSQQERLLIDKIKQMDRFRAFYFCGAKVGPLRVPQCNRAIRHYVTKWVATLLPESK